MSSSNFVYWSILCTFALLWHCLCMQFFFLFATGILKLIAILLHALYMRTTRMFEPKGNHGGDHRIDLRERRLSEHANCLLIRCPALLLLLLLLIFSQLFVTEFPFQVRCKLLKLYWQLDSPSFFDQERGARISWFWNTAISSLSNGYFVATLLNWTADSHTHTAHKIGISNT